MSALVDELRRYVESLEGARHAQGWDQPARLYRVYREDNGVLGVDEIRLDLFHDDPVCTVQMIAEAFEIAERWPGWLREEFARIGQHPTIAFCSIHEAWGRASTPEEHEEHLATPGKRRPQYADMPGSYEVRLAITILGRKILSYVRDRGKPPVWVDDRPVTDEVMKIERLTSALVRLTRADRLVVTR